MHASLGLHGAHWLSVASAVTFECQSTAFVWNTEELANNLTYTGLQVELSQV